MMTTKYFKLFKKQLKATGYEKAQGFDIDSFDKFDAQEKLVAEKELLNLISKQDSTAPSALAALMKNNAINILENVLSSAKCPSSFHREVAYALWCLTRDNKYIEELVLELEAKLSSQRLAALSAILSTGINHILINTFIDIATNDSDNIVRGTAARGILLFHGLLSSLDEVNTKYDSLLYSIASNDNNVKNSGIKELLSLIAG